jgi:PAS domain-containing protein
VVVENARLHSRLGDLARRARLAASASGFGYFTWEVDTDVVLWQNDRPYEIFGIDRAEPPINAERFVAEFLHVDDRAGFSAAVADAIDGSGMFNFRCRIHRKSDGGLRLVEFTGEAVSAGRAGRGKRVIGIVADVTERSEAHTDRH